MAVDVLDRCLVAPGYLVALEAEHGGDLITLVRAGSPTTEDDGEYALFIQAGPARELSRIDPELHAELIHTFDNAHAQIVAVRRAERYFTSIAITAKARGPSENCGM